MKKDVHYCSYTPDFPIEAYMIIANLVHRLLPKDYIQKYPFTNLVTTLDEAVRDIIDLSKYADTKREIFIEDFCTLVPVTFHSLFPQREEFWGNPSQNYDTQTRTNLINQAVSRFELYKLLATAYIENGTKTIATAIPFYLSAENSLVEKFMLTSDWPVDPEAKYAAFYLFKEPKRFNWKTKELKDLSESSV